MCSSSNAKPEGMPPMAMMILVLNAGSSSIKFQLFDADPAGALTRRLRGQLDGIGTDAVHLQAAGDHGTLADEAVPADRAADGDGAQAVLMEWLHGHMGGPPGAAGHRVVHGGVDFAAPVLVDDAVLAALEALVPLAPLHQPHNLAPIRALGARWPELPQVACFDTAFHRGHPALAERLPIPLALHDAGVRHYGFHGLSYEFIASRLPELAPELAGGRVVVLHMGSGASACAIAAGRSIDSTMGFTALDGLPMGTRPGRLDPGVVLHLMQQGRSAAEIERLLYHECGLQALSGISPDVRALLASDDPAARFALDFLAYEVAGSVASLGSALGGLDGLVFTAGVGEHAAPVREAILRRCAWLGLEVDPAANAAHGPRITAAGSRVPAYVIPTDEERMIARHTVDVLRQRR